MSWRGPPINARSMQSFRRSTRAAFLLPAPGALTVCPPLDMAFCRQIHHGDESTSKGVRVSGHAVTTLLSGIGQFSQMFGAKSQEPTSVRTRDCLDGPYLPSTLKIVCKKIVADAATFSACGKSRKLEILNWRFKA